MVEKAVSKFFSHLFETKRRRLALLGRFLCVCRTEYDDPIKLVAFYIKSIACEETSFQLDSFGMRITRGFYIPYTWLKHEEQEVIRWFIQHTDYFFNKEQHFRYNSLVLPQAYRMLLMRDYCAICTLQQTLGINIHMPTYALLACKILLQSEGDNIILRTCHWILDHPRAIAHELPIVYMETHQHASRLSKP